MASSYEWVLDKPYYIRYSPYVFADNSQAESDAKRALNDPVSHFALSGHLDELSVTRTDGGDPSVAISDCATGAPTTITLQIEHVLADPAHACPAQ